MATQPDATGQASVRYTFPTWVKTTPPLRGGYGCQHMKVGQSLQYISFWLKFSSSHQFMLVCGADPNCIMKTHTFAKHITAFL